MTARRPRRPHDARRDLGAAGERAVADWYRSAGYEIVDCNWRCREGELDLVVRRDRVVAFCEVKTRSSTAFGAPAEAVTATKRRRIRRLAARWLDEHRVGAGELRFDVASVVWSRGEAPAVDVIEGAF